MSDQYELDQAELRCEALRVRARLSFAKLSAAMGKAYPHTSVERDATVQLGRPPVSSTLSRKRKASGALGTDRDVFTSEMSYAPRQRDSTYLRSTTVTTSAASVDPFLGVSGPVSEDELHDLGHILPDSEKTRTDFPLVRRIGARGVDAEEITINNSTARADDVGTTFSVESTPVTMVARYLERLGRSETRQTCELSR